MSKMTPKKGDVLSKKNAFQNINSLISLTERIADETKINVNHMRRRWRRQ